MVCVFGEGVPATQVGPTSADGINLLLLCFILLHGNWEQGGKKGLAGLLAKKNPTGMD